MKSIFKDLGEIHHGEEDVLIPDAALSENENYQLGKYGRMRHTYLKEHRPVRYTCLMTQGKLWDHLVEIDKRCDERMDVMISAMKKKEGVTEALKAADQMEWVRRMNSIHHRAEEIVLQELVYEE